MITESLASQVNHKKKKNGAQGQNRTADTRIFSPLLYRLSYLGFNFGKYAAIKRWVQLKMVPRGRIELPTRGFSVLCSTD
jgi:hypothetical protein